MTTVVVQNPQSAGQVLTTTQTAPSVATVIFGGTLSSPTVVTPQVTQVFGAPQPRQLVVAQPGVQPQLNFGNELQEGLKRSLIHLADGVGGPLQYFTAGYREITGSPFPSAITWYETAAKVKKIVEKLLTYAGPVPVVPDTITWSAYDEDGTTVLASVTDTITYSGVFETSRTRSIS